MKNIHKLLTALLHAPFPALCAQDQDTKTSLTKYLRRTSDLGELRDIHAGWNNGVLKLPTSKAGHHAWSVIPAPQGGWDLARRATVNTEIINPGNFFYAPVCYSTAMFLDDRPSTRRLREWFWQLVRNPQS